MSSIFNEVCSIDELGEKVMLILKDGPATLEPLSLVNNSFGFVTFRMEYEGKSYETTAATPYLDLENGTQIQAAFDDDDDLVVTVFEEA